MNPHISISENTPWTKAIGSLTGLKMMALAIMVVVFGMTAGAQTISVKQHPTACQDNGTANSLKCSFASNTTVGNFIWVSASAYPGDSSTNPNCTVSDDGSDSFQAATGNGQHTAGGAWLYIWGAQVATAGKGVTVACTPAGGSTMYITQDIFELTIGSSTTWTFPDKGNAGAASGGTALSVSSFTPSNNNEMILVVATNDSNASFTAGSNFTLGSSVTTGQGIGTEYWLQSIATTTTAPFTESSSANWAEVASSVSAGGGGQAPSISNLSPTSGPVGTSVTISGSNFGSSQGSSTVKFNGTAATPTSWSSTSIVAPVPSGATTGNVVVTVGGTASNGVSFTVTSGSNGITLDQHPAVCQDTGTANSLKCSFASNTTVGNFVWVNASAYPGNSSTNPNCTVSDDGSDSFKPATGNGQHTSGGGWLYIWGAQVATAGKGVTVACTPASGATMYITLDIFELTNGSPATWTFPDTGNSAAHSGGTSLSVASFTPSNSNEMILVVAGNDSNASFTAGSNFTLGSSVTTGQGIGTEYWLQSTATATTAPFTESSSANWAEVASSVSAGGGGQAPSISNLSPTSGPVGTSVTISGSNFGSSQGSSTVKFNGTAATPTSWSSTSIVAPVPSGATTGNVVVTVGGTASNGVSFTVAPSITSLTPASGAVGSSIIIAGTTFGSSQGNGGVTFNGTAATISSWANTSITAVVPTGATTGNVVVTAAGGVASAAVSFTVTSAPNISSLTPNSGAIGSSIVIAGSNFGSSQGNGGVTFNGTAATISSWSNTSITAVVPTGATTGNVVVTAAGGVASAGVSFTVVPAPSISSLTPNSGAVGSSIVIAGSNFGSSQGNGGVTFNGTAATISSWSNTSITAVVPTGATTGNVVVTAAGGVASAGVSFTVVPAPSITSLTPNSGAIGSSIVIAGSNFGSTQGNGGVTFNGTAASISSWSNTSITAVVPTGATTGNIVVTAAGGVASAGVSFTVVPAPSITSLTPASGAVGSSIIIAGTTFGSSQGNGGVTFNGTAATISSWSNTSLTATVPNGGSSGNVVVTAAGGVSSAGVPFGAVADPSITGLTPNSAAVGSTIVIAGTNFGGSQGNGGVTFNGIAAAVNGWTSTSITTMVPPGATSGSVVVTVAGGVATPGVSFTVVPAPSISGVSPSSGVVGSSTVITGTNFGSTQGNGSVTFNATPGTVSAWSSTSITVTVPIGATTGNVVVTAAGGVPSVGVSFTVLPTPSISSLTPGSGAVGSAIVIAGSNFGSSQGNGSVTFNGTTATVSSWSNTSITATVPTGASTGNVVVTVSGGVASSGVSFTVVSAPSITSLTPNSGAVGISVTIAGSNYGGSQGNGGVSFNGTSATVSSWANTSITAVVPSGATTGKVVVTPAGGVSSNGVSFTVTIPPAITTLSPTSGVVGTSVTITGTNFGSSQGSSTVTFNGTAATVSSWSNTSIVAVVPAAATSGCVLVMTNTQSNCVNFTVIGPPTISSLSPTSGPVGTPVTITGNNFGSTQGNSIVMFSDESIAATPTSWSNTQIMVTVPKLASTGNVNVTVNGTASNGINFTVSSGGISTSPTSGAVGTSVTISGSNFGASQGNSTVTFGLVTATPSSWSNTQIVAPVPNGVVTGFQVLSVTVGGNTASTDFDILPAITSLSPNTSMPGSSVTITGTTFGASNGTNSFVTFNNQNLAATPTSWNDSQIVVTVPTGATTGKVNVTSNGAVSNGVTFTLGSGATPSITSLLPPEGAVGSSVVISGSDFGSTQGTVTFNGTSATITSWNNTSVTATAPANATTGAIVVTAGGVASNGVTFTVTPAPNISSISPPAALIGAQVTINGTNFGAPPAVGTVSFNGTAASVVTWADTSIIVHVPAGAGSGNVVVTAAGGIGSNGVPFTPQTAYSFTVTYAPNDDVLTANDSVNGNWTYTYDDFNRLSTAVATNGIGCAESYDQYGNRWTQQPQGTGNTCFSSSFSFTGNNSVNNNRIDTLSYDAAGNLLNDGVHNYSYDAENRIISVDSGQTATYVYDGEGRRIRKVTSAGTADFIYDQDGHVVAEVSGTGAWNRGEVYADSRHIATYNNGTTYFNQSDWLGTERARNTLNDDQCETITSLPFGDGQTIRGNCGDPSPNHFTGVPRDAETTLDVMGLRYYGSALGRFTVSDPGQIDAFTHIDDPQSWNGYAYARNNPLLFVDPTGQGHCVRPYGDRDNMISQADCEKLGGTFVLDQNDPQTVKNDSGDIGTVKTPAPTIVVEARNSPDLPCDAACALGAAILARKEAEKAANKDTPINPFGQAVGVRVGQLTGPITKQINCAAAVIYAYLPGVKPEDITDLFEDEGTDKASEALDSQAEKMEARAEKLARAKKKGTAAASRVAQQESKMLRHGAKLLKGVNVILNTSDAVKNFKDCEAGKDPGD